MQECHSAFAYFVSLVIFLHVTVCNLDQNQCLFCVISFNASVTLYAVEEFKHVY